MNNLYIHIYLFFFPLVLGNVLHMIIVKRNWFKIIAIPISKKLLGNSKTYRGIIVLPILTGLLALLSSYWFGPFEVSLANDAFVGFGLGLAYILAELPNSYIKRRLGIANGEQSKKCKYLQYFTDKADSLIGVLVFYFFVTTVSFGTILVLFCIGILLHISISQLLVYTKIKKKF
ncbi:CDP-archaeol synthase [Aestuariivivens sp. NBU2969]|uniref:CDP-archaeol synthase n=1 Tax=Aestuariivivens sp. NBU2969 TaxID=2873267 RepID=UPI001CBABF92|nr:CDP-archaeol synthase [Aestuariivivens sp. NBU2969]